MAPDTPYESTAVLFDKGVGEVELPSWSDFVAYIHNNLSDVPALVWRGQACASWDLQPSLERVLPVGTDDDSDILMFEHLRRFKLAARGRLNPRELEEPRQGNDRRAAEADDENDDSSEDAPLGPTLEEREENNWWAVGQHHGLKTPLLDWTTSPFVAAFFAFVEEVAACSNGEGRAIYGLNRRLVAQKSDEIREEQEWAGRPPVVDFVEPLYKDNPRLVSQGGLFTRAPDGTDIVSWVHEHYREDDEDTVLLLKLVLPDDDRDHILRALNAMNVNHQSLFPDLYGASEFVNFKLRIEDY